MDCQSFQRWIEWHVFITWQRRIKKKTRRTFDAPNGPDLTQFLHQEWSRCSCKPKGLWCRVLWNFPKAWNISLAKNWSQRHQKTPSHDWGYTGNFSWPNFEPSKRIWEKSHSGIEVSGMDPVAKWRLLFAAEWVNSNQSNFDCTSLEWRHLWRA